MGFQFRKRTKGTTGWLNFSGSGVSASIKLAKNVTVNLGKNGSRGTVNFGHGLRYVTSTSKPKRQTKPKPQTTTKRKPVMSYSGNVTPLHFTLKEIPDICDNIIKVFESEARSLEGDDADTVLAIRQAAILIKDSTNNPNDDRLYLINECIDELIRLKLKESDKDKKEFYTISIDLFTQIKIGYELAVENSIEYLKEDDTNKFSGYATVVFLIICIVVLQLLF